MGDSIWMRPERTGLPGPRRGFSRAQITEVAIAIADENGLDAASMRAIGARLGTSAMALYRYVPSRDDLIELMIDAVNGELELPDTPSGDWRADLTLLAHQLRDRSLRHPWGLTVLTGHPVFGPNTLRMLEFSLAALDCLGLSIAEMVNLDNMVTNYVTGFVREEVGWADETRRTGVTREEWMVNIGPYVREMLETGRYPMFARVLSAGAEYWQDTDGRFATGLGRVLDGIAASQPR